MNNKSIWIFISIFIFSLLATLYHQKFQVSQPATFDPQIDLPSIKIKNIEEDVENLKLSINSWQDRLDFKNQILLKNITYENNLLVEKIAKLEEKLSRQAQSVKEYQSKLDKNSAILKQIQEQLRQTQPDVKTIKNLTSSLTAKYSFEPNLNPNFSPNSTLHAVPPCFSEKIYGTNFPPTLIHSFMGAGNTWLRQAIESATGFYTGSAFRDRILYRGGLKGEFVDIQDHWNTLIGIKTHNPGDASGERNAFTLINTKLTSKCVILIRNPFDTFIAEYTRLTSNSHTSSRLNDTEFVAKFQTDSKVLGWMGLKPKDTTRKWLLSYKKAYDICLAQDKISRKYREPNPNNVTESHTAYLVFYENLKSNFVEEIRQIAVYLQEYDETRFQNCVETASETKKEGIFHRKSHVQIDPFTNQMKEAIQEMVRVLNQTYRVLPDSYLSYSIKS